MTPFTRSATNTTIFTTASPFPKSFLGVGFDWPRWCAFILLNLAITGNQFEFNRHFTIAHHENTLPGWESKEGSIAIPEGKTGSSLLANWIWESRERLDTSTFTHNRLTRATISRRNRSLWRSDGTRTLLSYQDVHILRFISGYKVWLRSVKQLPGKERSNCEKWLFELFCGKTMKNRRGNSSEARRQPESWVELVRISKHNTRNAETTKLCEITKSLAWSFSRK